MNILNRCDRRKFPELRVASPHATLLEHVGAPFAGDDAGFAESLQIGDPTCVIEMYVGIQYDSYVFDAKAQRSDVGDDLRHRLRQISIN